MKLTKLRIDGWIERVGILTINNNFIDLDEVAYYQREDSIQSDSLCHFLKDPRLAHKNDFPIIELKETYRANTTYLRFYNNLTPKYVQQVVLSNCYETPQSLFDITYNIELKSQDITLEMDDEHTYFHIRKLIKVNRVIDLPMKFNLKDIKFVKTKVNINDDKIVYFSYIPFLNGRKLEPEEYKEIHSIVKLIPR
jgi:hypothetical protein